MVFLSSVLGLPLWTASRWHNSSPALLKASNVTLLDASSEAMVALRNRMGVSSSVSVSQELRMNLSYGVLRVPTRARSILGFALLPLLPSLVRHLHPCCALPGLQRLVPPKAGQRIASSKEDSLKPSYCWEYTSNIHIHMYICVCM